MNQARILSQTHERTNDIHLHRRCSRDAHGPPRVGGVLKRNQSHGRAEGRRLGKWKRSAASQASFLRWRAHAKHLGAGLPISHIETPGRETQRKTRQQYTWSSVRLLAVLHPAPEAPCILRLLQTVAGLHEQSSGRSCALEKSTVHRRCTWHSEASRLEMISTANVNLPSLPQTLSQRSGNCRQTRSASVTSPKDFRKFRCYSATKHRSSIFKRHA